MPESVPNQIADAIVTRLAAIVGDGGATYWYTPNLAKRAAALTEDALDPSQDVLYFVIPDRKEERRVTTGQSALIQGRQFLTLALLKRHEAPTENPLEEVAPMRWTHQERMQRDVKVKLWADRSLGGVSRDLEITDSEEGAEQTHVERWALTFVRLAVTYHYQQETP